MINYSDFFTFIESDYVFILFTEATSSNEMYEK